MPPKSQFADKGTQAVGNKVQVNLLADRVLASMNLVAVEANALSLPAGIHDRAGLEAPVVGAAFAGLQGEEVQLAAAYQQSTQHREPLRVPFCC